MASAIAHRSSAFPSARRRTEKRNTKRAFKSYVAYKVRLGGGEEIVTKNVLPFGTGGSGVLLRAAAERGSCRLVKKLLDAGVSVFEAEPSATTALHLAANGTTELHAHTCKLLVDAKADIFLPNMDGFRAYDISVVTGATQVRLALKPSAADEETRKCIEDLEKTKQGDIDYEILCAAANKESEAGLLRIIDTLAKEQVNDLEGVQRKVRFKGKHNVTAMMIASDNNYAIAVRGLLKLGADPLAQSENLCTAVAIAAGEGHTEVVQELVEGSFTDKSQEERVELLSKMVNTTEKGDLTPLYRAAQGGFTRVAELLIGSKADVEAVRSDTGRGPLIAAARNGHCSMVRLLLENKASPEAKVVEGIKLRGGHDTLASAALFGKVHVIRVIAEHLGKQPELWKRLVDRQDDNGQTPLALAARYGFDEAVRALAQLEADASIKDKLGNSALAWACMRGHATLLPNLIEAMDQEKTIALFEDENAAGYTPLMLCCLDGHHDAAEMMVKKGANRSHRTRDGGSTALILAARSGHSKLVPIITHTQEGAESDAHDVERVVESGRTPVGKL